jgi:tetratricopeptide (TPR) repeat protein
MPTRGLIAALLAAIMLVAGALFFSAGSDETAGPSRTVDTSLLAAPVIGRAALDRSIAMLEERVQVRRDDAHSLAGLAAAYLQKARETADPTYYERAAEALERSLDIRPGNLPGLLASGQLDLARHDFRGALRWGRKALEVDESNSVALGIVGDALLELGRYGEGFRTVQRMVNLRPDLASYARVSYARELTGDVGGAVSAMERARDAGSAVAYNAAWTSNEIGDLHFNSGRLAKASESYRFGRRFAPSYPPLLAGLARVDAARGHLQNAIERLSRVVDRYPLPEYVVALGDAYQAAGERDAAEQQYGLVEAQQRLLRANGVLPDTEMTLFFADHGIELDHALRQARRHYEDRPSVRAADALAWALHAAGKDEMALRHSQRALRLGTRDALFHFHAGMIAEALGRRASARRHLTTALDINPHFSVLHAPVARRTLERS